MPTEDKTGNKVASLIPFGVHETKPRHFSSMLRIVWENRENLPYAWRVLSRGTCDGCALGTIGLRDWTLSPGETHLCMVRLELLRLNTMGPIPDFERLLADVSRLEALDSRALRELGRLPYPMRRRAGERGFSRLSWDELFAEVGPRLRSVVEHDADRFALWLTSRGITNETYYVGQKLARFLGTNNVDNSARLCHAPSGAALKDTIGFAATTCSYTDWFDANLIVFIGSNPANDQPVSMKYLLEAKRRGARVVTINTYREPGMERYWVPSSAKSAVFGTRFTDDFFLVHTGGDLALFNALAKLLLERGGVDESFVRAHTQGREALAAALAGQDLDHLASLSGVSRPEIERLATLISEAERGVLVWSMGATQHQHGADTVRAIANLGLLRGWVGRPGSGLMPIRGHSGVQGGAEMGAYATAFPGGKAIDAQSAAELSALYGFTVPSRPGLATAAMIDAAEAGRLDAFYVVGGNFLETLPQPGRVAAALANVPLRLHQDIVLTTQMLVPPKETVYLLPAKTRYEQRDGGTETTTERRVILSPHIPGHDVGETLSEWELLMRVGLATYPERQHQLYFESGAVIRKEIGSTISDYAKIAQLTEPGDNFQWGGPHLGAEGKFRTADGKAYFRPVTPPELSAPEGHLRLSTRRGKQFNSMVQAEVDPITGAGRLDVLFAPEDASRFGLSAGDPVLLENAHGRFEGRVALTKIRPGNVQAHWPEANVLLPRDRRDPHSGVPDYNAWVQVGALASRRES